MKPKPTPDFFELNESISTIRLQAYVQVLSSLIARNAECDDEVGLAIEIVDELSRRLNKK